ncbi:hypothetical protein AN641_07150 [Candidatus Epulonipiscioides gigas]|nr:hypothetical protein AN641_07150 [Epulopiscium sp. SCG-C07WGA-EpuloA2]
MKKILLYGIITTTLFLTLPQNIQALETTNYNLNSQIQQLDIEPLLPAFTFEQEDIKEKTTEEIEEVDETEFYFEEVEVELLEKHHYWGGQIGLRESYKYDINGNLMQKIDIEDNYKLITNYEYDENGKLIQEVRSNGEIVDYIYNKWGNLVEEIQHHDTYDTTTTYVYVYDDYNKLISKAFYNTRDQINAETYVYNENDQLIAEYIEGNKLPQCKYIYNETGQLIKKEYYVVEKRVATNKLAYETTFTYDEKGRLTQDEFYKYEYDNYGNLSREVSIYGADSFYTSYVYEYTQNVFKWKQDYIDFIESNGPFENEFQKSFYQLIYIDDDDIPELYIDGDVQYILSSKERVLALSTYGQEDIYYYPKSGDLIIDGDMFVEYYKLNEDEFALVSKMEASSYDTKVYYTSESGIVEYTYETMRDKMIDFPNTQYLSNNNLKSKHEIIEEIKNY